MTDDDPMDTFVLSAGPPVRTLAISAGAAVVGAGLVLLASVADLHLAVTVAGMALLVFGVLLGLTGLLLVARLKTTVATDDQAVQVTRGRRVRRVEWSKISNVRLAQPRLTLEVTGDEPLVLVNLRRASDPTFARLLVTLQRRLDADRGYRTGVF